MKKWIGILAIVYTTLLCAETVYREVPAETVMMGDFEESSGTGALSQNHPDLNVKEEVITADEYFGGEEEEEHRESLSLTSPGDYTMKRPKIALLVPRKVIGGYANSVANEVLSYLIYSNKHFIFEVFDSGTEDKDALTLAIQKIRHKGYKVVVAPLTSTGANQLASIEKGLLVYVPTVNQDDIYVQNPGFFYGGIDYKAQVDALLNHVDDKIVIFDDGSSLSKKISDYITESRIEDIVYSKVIKNVNANLSYLLKKNSKLYGANIFLNMPVVKSALVAAQLSRYKVPYNRILSTQVNYSPLLFTLTQYADREKFYIANAIAKAPFRLEDISTLLGADIRFNWIDYATCVGLDYLFTEYLSLQRARVFHEMLYAQQIYYDTEIVQPKQGSFAHIDRVHATPATNEERW
ncbi:MAG: hypothetical protein DSZ05_03510 [Sulfurospirillum sp.]|nr:MAG: hypothetical protein DSZ05_03510 [Sulfurospirillum sp.]